MKFKIYRNTHGWCKIAAETKPNRTINVARCEGGIWLVNQKGCDEFGDEFFVEELISFVRSAGQVPNEGDLIEKIIKLRI